MFVILIQKDKDKHKLSNSSFNAQTQADYFYQFFNYHTILWSVGLIEPLKWYDGLALARVKVDLESCLVRKFSHL